MKVEMDRESVIIFTPHHRIEGELHLPSTTRLSDRMNQAKDFLPITSARVYALDGRLLLQHQCGHGAQGPRRDADVAS